MTVALGNATMRRARGQEGTRAPEGVTAAVVTLVLLALLVAMLLAPGPWSMDAQRISTPSEHRPAETPQQVQQPWI